MGTPDAKVYMDAAPDTAALCEIPAQVPGGPVGSDAMRPALNAITKDMMGRVQFGVSLELGMGTNDRFTLIVPKRGATWTKNAAINFETNPANAQAGAALAVLQQNVNMQSQMAEKTLWASGGSITFTDIDQTKDAKITFTTTAVTFREINAQGGDVAGGCSSTFGAITGYLKQMSDVTRVRPSQDSTTPILEDAVIVFE